MTGLRFTTEMHTIHVKAVEPFRNHTLSNLPITLVMMSWQCAYRQASRVCLSGGEAGQLETGAVVLNIENQINIARIRPTQRSACYEEGPGLTGLGGGTRTRVH